MEKTLALLDCNNLCYRSFYTTGGVHGLRHDNGDGNGIPVGVTFGFLRDVWRIQESLDVDEMAFCWDMGEPLRKLDYPKYKEKRIKKKEEEDKEKAQARMDMHLEIEKLQTYVLPELGYRNIFLEYGYEADDLIAYLCNKYKSKCSMVYIISGDEDLYQCIDTNVSVCKIKGGEIEQVTLKKFRNKYGIIPRQWITVKSLAGCSSDDIKGLNGIGEKRAIDFINGKLKSNSVYYKEIVAIRNISLIDKNKKLVTLPYKPEKLPPLKIRKSCSNKSKWKSILKKFGFTSLRSLLSGM